MSNFDITATRPFLKDRKSLPIFFWSGISAYPTPAAGHPAQGVSDAFCGITLFLRGLIRFRFALTASTPMNIIATANTPPVSASIRFLPNCMRPR
jgi:hypothetical protein